MLISWLIDHEFAVHWYLLSASVIAAATVGAGILWESKGPLSIKEVAHACVLWGVVVEAVASVLLFAFDDKIAERQNDKIILLQRKNEILSLETAPRVINKTKFLQELSKAKTPWKIELKYFKDQPEPWWLTEQIFMTLIGTPWQTSSPTEITDDDRPPQTGDTPNMSGLLFVSHDANKDFSDPDSPLSRLMSAVLQFGFTGSMASDPRVPVGTVKVLASPSLRIAIPIPPFPDSP